MDSAVHKVGSLLNFVGAQEAQVGVVILFKSDNPEKEIISEDFQKNLIDFVKVF